MSTLRMRSDARLQDLLDPAELQAAFERVCETSGEFMEITAALNLDPERDFRFSDLRDVDFSKADLRGFDFRGADLRGAYGTDVRFDGSTNLTDADLHGSCFATYYREFLLFRDNRNAGRMYKALYDGDPFEVSAWLHQRYRNQRERHSILKKADPETAAILCQKLLADDIDLTKRTDLFYFLRRITSSPTELRELMLNIFARHSENTALVEKFATIASRLHGDDLGVRGFIIKLCEAQSPRVRLSAFKASTSIGIFMQNYQAMKSLFMADQNADIRKELVLESATALGRHHLAAVNRTALLDGVKAGDVLDVPEFFDGAVGSEIAAATRRRLDEIAARFNPDAATRRIPADSSPASAAAIYERQAEVLCSAPVLRTIFAREDPPRSMAARARLSSREERERRKAEQLAQLTIRSFRRSPWG